MIFFLKLNEQFLFTFSGLNGTLFLVIAHSVKIKEEQASD